MFHSDKILASAHLKDSEEIYLKFIITEALQDAKNSNLLVNIISTALFL